MQDAPHDTPWSDLAQATVAEREREGLDRLRLALGLANTPPSKEQTIDTNEREEEDRPRSVAA